jgi:hypothetical protein
MQIKLEKTLAMFARIFIENQLIGNKSMSLKEVASLKAVASLS